MSTAARKARKRAGVPFTKAAKVGTPNSQRANQVRVVDSVVSRIWRTTLRDMVRGFSSPRGER